MTSDEGVTLSNIFFRVSSPKNSLPCTLVEIIERQFRSYLKICLHRKTTPFHECKDIRSP